MPQRGTKYNPCNNKRSSSDIPGIVSDFINCYLLSLNTYVQAKLPILIIALILIVVMVLAAREFVKE